MSLDQLTENEQSRLLSDAALILHESGIGRFSVHYEPINLAHFTLGTLIIRSTEHDAFSPMRSTHLPTFQNVRKAISALCEREMVMYQAEPLEEEGE